MSTNSRPTDEMPLASSGLSRRQMLLQAGAGFGALPLASLLGQQVATSPAAAGPLLPHYFGSARSVIFLFMEGGPSHIDTFDPKPLLNELAGQSLPKSFKRVITAMGEIESPLLASQRKWKQHGECGTWVSDWLPHTAECVDDIAVLRGCWSNGINHSGGVCQMNTGSTLAGRPSLGSWVTYGLGTENDNLPAFIVMKDSSGTVANGPRNWSAGFMPAVYQGTQISATDVPIENLALPKHESRDQRRRKLDYLNSLNRLHAESRTQQSELEARIASYELTARMQMAAPEAVDLSQETDATKAMYGLDDAACEKFGRMCLMSRRLVERGVRFIQLYHGAGSKWDAHSGIEKNHTTMCRQSDLPVSGLLRDLKQRGLLDSTLVVWGGEFGRTPMSEKGDGRDHNATGFTMWMAGGGVKGGQVIGGTDELGFHAVQDRMHVHDLHATILHLMGVDHSKLIYLDKGRPERPTINEGAPMKRIVTG